MIFKITNSELLYISAAYRCVRPSGAYGILTGAIPVRRVKSVSDTKSGKRREMIARVSFDTACELGFRGSLDEWERLMGAVARR